MDRLDKSSGSDMTMSGPPRRIAVEAAFIENACSHSGGTTIDGEDIDALVQERSHGCVAGLTTTSLDEHCGRSANRGHA
jgi:hypothetical protein